MELVTLSPSDADGIVELERRSFIPPLQVAKETLLKRFALGHHMFGLEDEGQLVAMISFSYGRLDPNDFASFPKTLKELCLQPVPADYDTAFLYNLEVDPRHRGSHQWKTLVKTALDRAKADGCRQAVANARIPSYAGSDARYMQEHVSPQPELREAIDAYLRGGPFPSDEALLKDPLLAIYRRICGCRFLWIVPGFAPDDQATGGIRVIAYLDMGNWPHRG